MTMKTHEVHILCPIENIGQRGTCMGRGCSSYQGKFYLGLSVAICESPLLTCTLLVVASPQLLFQLFNV